MDGVGKQSNGRQPEHALVLRLFLVKNIAIQCSVGKRSARKADTAGHKQSKAESAGGRGPALRGQALEGSPTDTPRPLGGWRGTPGREGRDTRNLFVGRKQGTWYGGEGSGRARDAVTLPSWGLPVAQQGGTVHVWGAEAGTVRTSENPAGRGPATLGRAAGRG